MSHKRANQQGFTRQQSKLLRASLGLALLTSAGAGARADGPPQPTRAYTLRETLQTALDNPRAAMRWRVAEDKASSNVSLAKTQLYPLVTSNIRALTSASGDVITYSSDQIAFSRERTRIGLSVTYPLYDAGKRMAQLRAARAGLRATQAGIQDGKIQLLSETANSFYVLLHRQRLAESGELRIKAAQEHLRGAQSRLEVGAVTKGDVLTAQSALATATAEAGRRNQELVAARAHLANLMGGDPTTLAPLAAEPETRQEVRETTEQLIARAIQYSPARVQALAQREAARAQLSTIRAEQSPKVEFRANGGYVMRDDPTISSSDKNKGYIQVNLELTLPLFQGPSIRAREKNQIAEIGLQDLTLKQLEDDIKEQILVASTAYQASVAQVKASREAVAAAAEAHRLAEERYTVGKGAQVDVLDTLNRLIAARDALADAESDRDVAGQNLRWITGIDRPPSDARTQK